MYVLFVHPSVRMEEVSSPWKDFMKLDIWGFFENLSRKFEFD